MRLVEWCLRHRLAAERNGRRAQDHDLGLVGVQLQVIPQEPGVVHASAETSKNRRGVGRVESNDKLYVIGEFEVRDTVRADETANRRRVCCEMYRGPRTDSCGTPASHGEVSDDKLGSQPPSPWELSQTRDDRKSSLVEQG